MVSPSYSTTAPEGAILPPTSSRRRALSYLRTLSQTRSSAGSPTESSRTSPRSYFQRSISYTESRNPSDNSHTRRRSNSRPSEPTTPTAAPKPLDRVSSAGEPTSHPRHQSPTPGVGEVSSASGEREGTSSELVRENTGPSPTDTMARNRQSGLRRTISSGAQPDVQKATNDATETASRPKVPRTTSSRATSGANGEVQEGDSPKTQPPTIRLFPHQEVRNGRSSLNFPPVSRTLPSEHSIIRVGRYSEREGIPNANPTAPSDAPVGFKSKVVSRKHCEFCFADGQWQIKDVASSSGTFLNHIRLSQPNTESRLFPVKDGDIVQLGIDFRGGEEMIFRCVKIRIECNRSWQKKPNNFNKSRHAQLQSLAKEQAAANTNSNECSICLGGVLPCQSLFVAPCAHVWHYKCIRPLLEGKNSTYPQFQCPNCRAYTDLTAEVDIAESDIDEWMDNSGNEPNTEQPSSSEAAPISATEPAASDSLPVADPDATPPAGSDESTEEHTTSRSVSGSALLARRQAANPSSPEINSVNAIDMPGRADESEVNGDLEEQRTRTESPDPDQIISGEGPLTPRNNAGPFVFDGSAGRASSGRRLVVAGIPEITEAVD